jgi:uncharacterized membrane protein YtjA (UPF0391 family)
LNPIGFRPPQAHRLLSPYSNQSAQSRRALAPPTREEKTEMLKLALFFAIVAVIAALLGFTGVAAGAAAIAKILFFIFLVLCIAFLLLGVFVAKKIVD